LAEKLRLGLIDNLTNTVKRKFNEKLSSILNK